MTGLSLSAVTHAIPIKVMESFAPVFLHVLCSDGVGATITVILLSLSCYHSDELSSDDFIGTGFIKMSDISAPGENGKALCMVM